MPSASPSRRPAGPCIGGSINSNSCPSRSATNSWRRSRSSITCLISRPICTSRISGTAPARSRDALFAVSLSRHRRARPAVPRVASIRVCTPAPARSNFWPKLSRLGGPSAPNSRRAGLVGMRDAAGERKPRILGVSQPSLCHRRSRRSRRQRWSGAGPFKVIDGEKRARPPTKSTRFRDQVGAGLWLRHPRLDQTDRRYGDHFLGAWRPVQHRNHR